LNNTQLVNRWKKFSNAYDRSLFQEYCIFCNFATEEQFENFLNQKNMTEDAFYDLLSFFYEQNCLLFLFKLLRDNRDFCIEENKNIVKYMKISDKLEKRMKRFLM